MRHGTYSIVARDPATGELGAAVQSHWFSVGSICIWARPGVGVVATQSIAEPAYGPRALDRLAAGAGAPETLPELLAADELRAMRQVAVIDGQGGIAAHTGERCIAHAAHVTGADHSCQANMMLNDTVPAAMAGAFEAATGTLAERLLAALEAAQGEGGDVRGSQSAAMLVVPATGEPWQRSVDLRVEDHPEPLTELGRLLVLQRAYDLADEADQLLAAGDTEAAGERYERANGLAPGSEELCFWAGLARAQAGDVEAGAGMVRSVIERNPNWRLLLERLEPEFAPAGEAVRRALG